MDNSLHFVLKENIPFLYRLLEGFTTGFMMTGYIASCTDDVFSVRRIILLLVYFIHWYHSIVYHLYPSQKTFQNDIFFINLVILFRLMRITSWTLYPLLVNTIIDIIVFQSSNIKPSLIITKIIMGSCWLVFNHQIKSGSWYIVYQISALICYLISDWRLYQNELLISVIFCCLYHMMLGLYTFNESLLYNNKDSHPLFPLLFYSTCILSVFNYGKYIHRLEKKRLASTTSLAISITLTPFCIREIFQLCTEGTVYIQNAYQENMIWLYLAYCIVDSILGLVMYPELFMGLDGFIHHILTGIFISVPLFLKDIPMTFSTVALVTETPSILLFASRVFPTNPHVRSLRRNIFPSVFLFFRIILLGVLILRFLADIAYYVVLFYIGITMVNMRWYMAMKKNSNNRFSCT